MSNNSPDLEAVKRDRNKIIEILHQKDGGINFGSNNIRCPFHPDKTKSARIAASKITGVWRFECFVCKDIGGDVIELTSHIYGIPLAEAFELLDPAADRQQQQSAKGGNNNMNNENQEPKQQVEAPKQTKSFDTFEALLSDLKTWKQFHGATFTQNPYTDPATGETDLIVIRIDLPSGDKTFRPASKNKTGRYHLEMVEGKKPLFNRNRVSECLTVVVVEGEKAVRAVTALNLPGVAATTSPMGAGSADKADWSPLAGKNVIIWRDFDEDGTKYQKTVIEQLAPLEPFAMISVVEVETLGLNPKDDVVDYLATIIGTEPEKQAALSNVIADAKSLAMTDSIVTRYADIISGKFRTLKFPGMDSLSNLTQALLPGTVTLLCGDPNAGKTFFLLQNIRHWICTENLKIKVMMLEEDLAFYQTRLTAQMCEVAGLANNDFIKVNAKFATDSLMSILPDLEKISRSIICVENEMWTLDRVADWVIEQADKGADIIVVDPITLALASPKPWIDDQMFLLKIKFAVKKTGARLIISTHPKGGKAGALSMSGLAGGAVYPRAAQSILWLQNLEQLKESSVWIDGKKSIESHRQILQVLKCRSGKGLGSKFAVNLNHETLAFDHIGLIAPESNTAGGAPIPTYDVHEGAPKTAAVSRDPHRFAKAGTEMPIPF